MLLTISLSTTSNSLLKESKRDKKSKIGLSVCSYVPSTCFSRNQLVTRKVSLVCRSVGLYICPPAIVSLQHGFQEKGRLTLSTSVSVSPSVHLSASPLSLKETKWDKTVGSIIQFLHLSATVVVPPPPRLYLTLRVKYEIFKQRNSYIKNCVPRFRSTIDNFEHIPPEMLKTLSEEYLQGTIKALERSHDKRPTRN